MLHDNPGRHHTAHDRPLSPEAVYLRRMLAWPAVVLAGFVGIELVINDFTAIGVLLIVVAIAGALMLRLKGLTTMLRSKTPAARDDEESKVSP